ncbi:MAG: hypothetical protein PHT78_07580 [Desulfitobacteriaceae bacterium]|nr:hypothetical protein [Desulfitobacteriaceae bacterium]MDD4753093.1 hypothetical protein [Desulfitobacteriaceae bacterium]
MEDKTITLLEKLYIEFTKFREETNERFNKVDERFNGIDERFNKVNADINGLKSDVIRIENNHGTKLDALFDLYTQHTQQLDRIAMAVARHESIIIKKAK